MSQRHVTGLDNRMGPASAQAPSSTGADDGHTSTTVDLEAGDSTAARTELADGVRANEGLANEAYERAEQDERADRQRAMNPAWYLHQWLGWGW
jgi:hypothetical protein